QRTVGARRAAHPIQGYVVGEGHRPVGRRRAVGRADRGNRRAEKRQLSDRVVGGRRGKGRQGVVGRIGADERSGALRIAARAQVGSEEGRGGDGGGRAGD